MPRVVNEPIGLAPLGYFLNTVSIAKAGIRERRRKYTQDFHLRALYRHLRPSLASGSDSAMTPIQE